MNVVVSDTKSGKAFNAKTEQPVFVGKKIGDEIDLTNIGLAGYTAKITGGSDKQGFPMKPGLGGSARIKALLKKGIGFKPKRAGIKKKKSVRGNTIDVNTAQINVKVIKAGSKSFADVIGKEAQKPKDATPELSAKERLVKDSLSKAGSEELAYEKTKPKAKKG